MTTGLPVHPRFRRYVRAHFAGRLSPSHEDEMRRHLTGCEGCKDHYRRHLLFSELDPAALDWRERLGRGLGLWRPPAARRRFVFPGLLAALLLPAAALIMIRPATRPADPARSDVGFQARGGFAANDGRLLAVYKVSVPGPPHEVAAGDRVRASDEFAFAYTNPGGFRYLLVFGIDGERNVHWYHPEWKEGSAAPSPVAIRAASGTTELPDAVRHDLREGALTMVGLFTNRAVAVVDLETRVRTLPVEALRRLTPSDFAPLVDTADQVVALPLQVEP